MRAIDQHGASSFGNSIFQNARKTRIKSERALLIPVLASNPDLNCAEFMRSKDPAAVDLRAQIGKGVKERFLSTREYMGLARRADLKKVNLVKYFAACSEVECPVLIARDFEELQYELLDPVEPVEDLDPDPTDERPYTDPGGEEIPSWDEIKKWVRLFMGAHGFESITITDDKATGVPRKPKVVDL